MIGVFDSGIGGLTVLGALQEAMPETGFLYYGDHKNAPYGDKSAEDIHQMTRDAVRFMFDQGVDLVVLACNTASAVALHDLQVDWLPENDDGRDRRVLGVFVPLIEAMTRRDWGDNSPPTHTGLSDVVLFATPASVKSGAFERELRFRARDVSVTSIPCPDLVPRIEAGDKAGVAEAVGRYVAEGLAINAAPQTAALGCTHYPHALDEFRAALPDETVVFSQPEIVAKSLGDYLARHKRFQNSIGKTRYLTNGNAKHVSVEATRFTGKTINFEEEK